jgi:hypothetical protein
MATKNTSKLNYQKRRELAKVVGGEILFMVTEGMTKWLDTYNARIVGQNEGKVILACDDKDWKKFYKDLFKEEYNEVD